MQGGAFWIQFYGLGIPLKSLFPIALLAVEIAKKVADLVVLGSMSLLVEQ